MGKAFRVIDAKELMRLHVHTLFTCDNAGRLMAVNEPGGAAAPRFFFGQTPADNAWWFPHDIDPRLAIELDTLCRSLPTAHELDADPGKAAQFLHCLAREELVRRTWAGPAFRCPSDLPRHASAVRVTPFNATLAAPPAHCAPSSYGLPIGEPNHSGNAR